MSAVVHDRGGRALGRSVPAESAPRSRLSARVAGLRVGQKLWGGFGALALLLALLGGVSLSSQSRLMHHVDALRTGAVADRERVFASVRSTYDTGRLLSIVILVVGLALAAVIAVAVSRAIVRPTRHMVEVLQQVAHGDLRVRSDFHSTDEIGQMSAALDETLQRTQDTIRSIGDSALTLAASAEELSASAEQVSANVTTVSAGTEELTASVGEIARNAGDASATATDAVDLAVVASDLVNRLSQSSQEIGSIVEMITGISEQTNLLALNATIEAARAGVAGRGFAVVANEVKDLAQETGRATESIRTQVHGIQEGTTEARDAIERIAEVIRSINTSQQTIAAAVEEQSVTTAEMSRQLGEAAMVTSAIAGGSSETATASAADLARMAAQLQSLVGRFEL